MASDSICNFPTPVMAAALVAAQKEFLPAAMGGKNPHFKSRYARYSDVHDACVPALHKHDFAVLQSGEGSDDAGIQITTTLLHASGDKVTSVARVPLGTMTAQGAGSAITYARRYGLAMACGLYNDDDDDGNAATQEQHAAPPRATQSSKAKKPIKERTAVELLSLRSWADGQGKADLVAAVDAELDHRTGRP